MDDIENKDPNCNCSFCGKDQGEVAKLIAGPDGFICDECIDLCNEIVRDEDVAEVSDGAPSSKGALKPMEIPTSGWVHLELNRLRNSIVALRA